MKKADRNYFMAPPSAAGKKVYLHDWNENSSEVVLYIHGFPGCGDQARLMVNMPQLKGYRVLSFDRPGYGLSENQKDLTPLKFAKQIVEILDELKIDRIRILSVSGGAPFSLALALLLKDRVVKLSSVGGVVPLNPKNFRYMNSQHRKAWFFIMLTPYPVAYKLLTNFWEKGLDEIDKFLFTSAESVGGVDRVVFTDPEISAVLSETFKIALNQGPHAILRDLKIYAKHWGFSTEEVSCPITLWHGSEDSVVNVIYAKEMRGRLKNANLKVVDNEGHYSLPMNFRDQIISDLLDINHSLNTKSA